MPQSPAWRQAATYTLHTAIYLKSLIEEHLTGRCGLLLADHEALIHLTGEPRRMSDIAELLTLSRGGTTKVIDRLESLGYVERRPDPADRRATMVILTTSGRRAVQTSTAALDEALETIWKDHVSEREAATVVAVMERVLEANRRG